MTATTDTAVAVGDRITSNVFNIGDLLRQNDLSVESSVRTGTAGLVFATLSTTPPVCDAVRTSVDWATVDAVGTDDSGSVETVVTRILQRDYAIEIDRYLRIRDSHGTVREEGTETWSAPWTTAVRSSAGTGFCTKRWADVLAESLARDRTFEESLATWDGTIGLRCTDGSGRAREVHLRIYRGRIIDVARRTPLGATFTFTASAVHWIDLVTTERNEFMRRAIRGEFSTSGDGYEYLRLTKPLGTIIEHARTIAKETDA